MRQQGEFPVPADRVSETAEMLSRSVARWAETEVIPHRTARRESWEDLLEPALRSLLDGVGLRQLVLGPDGPAVAEHELGAALALALEGVGRADTGLAVLLASTLAVHVAAGRCGSDEAKRLLLGARGTGLVSIVLPGYGEPSPGLAGLAAQVSAERHGETWVLTADRARPQCASRDAALFAVVCDVGSEPGVVLVPAGSPGLTRHAAVRKTGLAASRNGDVTFDGVEVGEALVLGRGGASCVALAAWYQLGCAAAVVGAQLAAWEILRDWVAIRPIKGRGGLLRDNSLAAALLGEIGAGVATSRLLLLDLATLLGSPGPFGEGGAGSKSASATAAAVARAVLRTAMDGLDGTLELMGSAGYATEWNVERCWRDIRTLTAHLGPEPHVQVEMARHYFGSEPDAAGGTAR